LPYNRTPGAVTEHNPINRSLCFENHKQSL
jgi:hypothetical protein